MPILTVVLYSNIVFPSKCIYFFDNDEILLIETPSIQNKCVVIDDLETKMFSDSKL